MSSEVWLNCGAIRSTFGLDQADRVSPVGVFRVFNHHDNTIQHHRIDAKKLAKGLDCWCYDTRHLGSRHNTSRTCNCRTIHPTCARDTSPASCRRHENPPQPR
jgi:hypothetical protein